MRLRFAGAAIATLLLAAIAPAAAQSDYPARPIRLIVGYTAGGGTDRIARVKLEKAWSEAVHDPRVSGKLKAMALVPGNATPQQFTRIIDSDVVKFRGVVQAAGLKFEE